MLLAAGSAVNARARNGSTPLHWAAGGGHTLTLTLALALALSLSLTLTLTLTLTLGGHTAIVLELLRSGAS